MIESMRAPVGQQTCGCWQWLSLGVARDEQHQRGQGQTDGENLTTSLIEQEATAIMPN